MVAAVVAATVNEVMLLLLMLNLDGTWLKRMLAMQH